MNSYKHSDSPVTLIDYLRAVRESLRRRAGTLTTAAVLAAVAVILTVATSDPIFRSTAEVTSFYDDDVYAGVTPSGAGELISPGLRFVISRPKGQIFPHILKSRGVTNEILSARYHYQVDGEQRYSDLYEYLGVKNRDAAGIVLRSRVAAFYLDPETGVTKIVVDTRSPELSRQIAEKYLGALEEALNALREQEIRLALTAVETKLEKHSAELARVESELRALRERNRDYEPPLDPTFYLQQIQLERDVELYETLVVAMKSQYELTVSRLLDRDRRLTVVASPTVADTYAKPRWGMTVFLAVTVALVVLLIGAGLLAGLSLTPAHEKQKWSSLLDVFRNDLYALRGAGRFFHTVKNGRAAR